MILTTLAQAFNLLPPAMNTQRAQVMMLSAGFQESGMAVRRQYGNGPARGLWQFEQGGGVKGVMENAATREYALAACAARGCEASVGAVWARLETDDILAAVFARLLLWADPHPLPAADDLAGTWDCYLRNWRPGKPRPADWAHSHALATQAMGLS